MIRDVDDEETPEERAELERLEQLVEQDLPELFEEANAHRRRMEARGRMLRASREAAGLGVAELAERTGFDAEWLERLEKGWQNPTLVELERIASAVGKSLDVRFVDAA